MRRISIAEGWMFFCVLVLLGLAIMEPTLDNVIVGCGALGLYFTVDLS